jgi:hypothetical protein
MKQYALETGSDPGGTTGGPSGHRIGQAPGIRQGGRRISYRV